MRNRLPALLIAGAIALTAQNPNTAKFPTAVATDQDLLAAKDSSHSTLSSGINSSTLTIPVANGSTFLDYELITIDDEDILVCSVASNTLTVCASGRGHGGTTAAAHSSGAGVDGWVEAWHHNQAAAEIKAIETALGPNLANVQATSTGAPNYTQSFTSQTSVSVTHGLGTKNLLLTCFDASDNHIEPLSWSVAGTTPYAITVTFSAAQTGRCVVNGIGGGYRTVRLAGYEVGAENAAAALVTADLTSHAIAVNDATAKTLAEASCISDAGDQTVTVKIGSTTLLSIHCVAPGTYSRSTTDGTTGYIIAGSMGSTAVAAGAQLDLSGTANASTKDIKLHVYATVD